MNFGPTELIIILVIVIIIFGVGRLGDVGAALGKSIKEFRKASTDDESNSPPAPKDTSDAGKPSA